MSGNGAFQEEMNFEDRELNAFALATHAALVAVPDPALGRNLVPELAAAAAVGHRDEVYDTTARPTGAPRRSRRGLVARIALAVALVPALFAGLAVAGVSVPQPADDAFNALGINLPNQEGSDESGGGSQPGETPGTESPGGKGNGQGQDKQNPARAGGRGNGAQGRGRALGKRGIPPGHDGSPGNSGNSNAGGNGNGKAVGKDGTPPGQARPKPVPVHPPTPPKPPAPDQSRRPQENVGVGSGSAGGNGKGPVKKALAVVSQTLTH